MEESQLGRRKKINLKFEHPKQNRIFEKKPEHYVKLEFQIYDNK